MTQALRLGAAALVAGRQPTPEGPDPAATPLGPDGDRPLPHYLTFRLLERPAARPSADG